MVSEEFQRGIRKVPEGLRVFREVPGNPRSFMVSEAKKISGGFQAVSGTFQEASGESQRVSGAIYG